MIRRLIGAAAEGDCEAWLGVLETGCDVNAADVDGGFTALMAASLFGHRDAVELLLCSGADLNRKDRTGMTALDYAVLQSHLHVIERFVLDPRLDRTTTDYQGHTVLINAVIAGDFNVIEFLLKNGFDPNADCPLVVNPLLYAIRKGKNNIADLLRLHGAREITHESS
jgi:ankyrin repeat protein